MIMLMVSAFLAVFSTNAMIVYVTFKTVLLNKSGESEVEAALLC